ncbi:hypothetical protein DYB26_002134 [Aphanomyces astaci]|uniref:Pru domain-containing protein n=2 Tax=Aphanomyces astaci TaxID=112090 RepID=A0A3R6XPN8_APHAT|nr:hypothetical protein DYB26_002134 [Aphanomyces astaci]
MTAVAKEPGSTKLIVTPDIQKGKIALVRGDDQLLHFQWKNRTTGANVDDYILFPQDATFEKVDTSRPQDRVYVLQYKGSARRFFYWLQDSSKDAEQAKKVNDLINATTPPTASGTSARAPGGNGANPGGQLDHNAIMQMLGALGGGQEAAGGNGAPNSVQMAELQQILQHMGMPQGSNPNAASPVSSPVPHDHDSGHEDDDDDGQDDVNMEELSEEELLRLAIEESMRDVQDTEDDGVAPPSSSVPTPSSGGAGIQLADLQRAMALAQQQHVRDLTRFACRSCVVEDEHDASRVNDLCTSPCRKEMSEDKRGHAEVLEPTVNACDSVGNPAEATVHDEPVHDDAVHEENMGETSVDVEEATSEETPEHAEVSEPANACGIPVHDDGPSLLCSEEGSSPMSAIAEESEHSSSDDAHPSLLDDQEEGAMEALEVHPAPSPEVVAVPALLTSEGLIQVQVCTTVVETTSEAAAFEPVQGEDTSPLKSSHEGHSTMDGPSAIKTPDTAATPVKCTTATLDQDCTQGYQLLLPSSAKKLPQLTHPTSPDLQSSKRHFRCADHGRPTTQARHHGDSPTSRVLLPDLVSRAHQHTSTTLRSTVRRPTSPHSPFLLTAHRAKLKPSSDAPPSRDFGHVYQAADLMRRDHAPQVYVATTTSPHSPYLVTAHRAKMHPTPASTSAYGGGYVDPAVLVLRGHHDKENQNTTQHRPPTRPQSPHLVTTTRTRTPYQVDDLDGIELAKPFHAHPMPSFKRRKVTKAFESKIQADMEAEALRRVFKAAPMPVPDTLSGLHPVKRLPLTEIEPFHMPGDRFDELAKARLAAFKADAEKARLQRMEVKATPIFVGRMSSKSKKGDRQAKLTRCASPDLAVKRRAVARAEFDSKDKARRQREMDEARAKMEMDKEEDAVALRAYRATLSFKHHT